jgi:hypothetical protein
MGHLQESINVKILEGMNVTTYNLERGRLIVASSKKIKSVNVNQADIDAAMAAFHQDSMILNYFKNHT